MALLFADSLQIFPAFPPSISLFLHLKCDDDKFRANRQTFVAKPIDCQLQLQRYLESENGYSRAFAPSEINNGPYQYQGPTGLFRCHRHLFLASQRRTFLQQRALQGPAYLQVFFFILYLVLPIQIHVYIIYSDM